MFIKIAYAKNKGKHNNEKNVFFVVVHIFVLNTAICKNAKRAKSLKQNETHTDTKQTINRKV